ncbi:deoxynucleoside monophosphate kinase [Providencia phage vB_PreS_PR1]|uniref:Deoxynucleoside monophosphate kinase n=1 Tax=Providencia phage vB_PreS_PR1 TaxID=1931407 RepID=A0A1S6KV02_9CAUD|nr:deoxynucleoside monophosphate kinase [Providencia phage vB_PreS_PR1]AQT25246.1 deoxynucleoside monophosphate kinase [Providencia phage vB_PreS_PR1]
MTNKTLIGLSGAAGSGKDFAARFISQQLGVEIVSFAEPVYTLAGLIFGVTPEELGNRSTKEKFFFLQVDNENLIKAVDYAENILSMLGLTHIDARTELFEWLTFDLANYRSPITLHERDDMVAAYYISPRKILEHLGTELGRARFSEGIWLDLVAAKYAKSEKGIVITDVRFPNEHDWVKEVGGTRWGIKASKSDFAIQSSHPSASHTFEVDFSITNNYDETFTSLIREAMYGS